MRRIFVITFVAVFFCISLSYGQTDTVKQDFSVLDGVIIIPVAGEFLIDLDITSGINEGDIFTLVKEGEKVIHPVTKEVLGTLDVPIGYMVATRIKNGYSYAKLISGTITPKKGDKVKRFEQVPAAIDSTVPPEISNQLRTDLPQLQWTANEPMMSFTYLDNELIVKGAADTIIHKYSFNNDTTSSVGTITVPAPPSTDPFSIQPQANQNSSILNSAVNDMLGSIGLGKSDSRLEKAGIIYSSQQNSEVWTSIPFEGKPTAVTVGDFDNDLRQEMVLVSNNTIQIVRLVAGEITELNSLSVNTATTILGLDAMDINSDGTPEIIVNSIHDSNKLNSQLLQYNGSEFIVIADQLEWYLRSANLPDEGQVLLGQQIGSGDTPFSGPISIMNSVPDAIVPRENINVPSGTTIFALSSLTAPDGKNLYSALSPKDRLQVFSPQGVELWQSGADFGGSEIDFSARPSGRDEITPVTYIQPKIAQLSNSTILVPQNDGSRFLQRYRNFDPSRIVALSWDGARLKELWHTVDQPAYLADLCVADADNDGKLELVTLVRFKGSDIISKSQSNLVLYQLDNINQ